MHFSFFTRIFATTKKKENKSYGKRKVDIFSEGFDFPDIEFIQLARPTKSLVKYLQQVGRGLRPTNGKSKCIILDNVGAHLEFALPDSERSWEEEFVGEPKRRQKGIHHIQRHVISLVSTNNQGRVKI